MTTIKDLRLQTGLSQSAFAKYFGIPVKTIQNWEIQRTSPPTYVVTLIEKVMDLEQTVLKNTEVNQLDK